MNHEAAILLFVLLWAIGILPLTGAASFWYGRWAERRAAATGALGAALACGVGFIAALAGLTHAVEGRIALPWRIPAGELALGLDPLSSFFLLPLFLLAGLAAIYAGGYFKRWAGRNPGRFWFFYNTLIAGMALVILARNGVLFLVAWEVMSLASFFLVVWDDTPSSREAGWIYLVATHLSAAFLIALFAWLGRAEGSQDFATWRAGGAPGLVFVLALLGFGAKAGFFPLHVWLPEAHPAAPSPVSAVMSAVLIKTGIYGLVRMVLIVGAVPVWAVWLLLGIGAVSGIMGILFALAQRDLKRLLAYSSGENMGIVALGLGLGLLGVHHHLPAVAALGFAGALLHVLNHALFKGLLFMGAGAVAQATGTRNIEQLGGLLKRMPLTGLAFFAGAAAICALPPFNGFVSEFLLFVGSFQALLATGSPALGGLVVVVSLALIGGLALACFTKAFGVVFQGEPRTTAAANAAEVSSAMTVPILLLAGLCLTLGVGAVFVVRGLLPVVAQLAGTDAALLASSRVPAVLSGLLLLLLAGASAMIVVRRRLLAARRIRETVTWDCGYAAPAPRMQYTGASFVQPLTREAQSILRVQRQRQEPVGIFPAAAQQTTVVPDVARRAFFDPLFRLVGAGLGWFRRVQAGRVHLYVLYIVVALLALLGWALWS